MTLSALYFPGTSIPSHAVGPLSFLFDRLTVYRPTEAPWTLPSFLHGTGWLESYPPAPLGAELGRFQRLIRDLQSHAAEYYHASLASWDRDDEPDWPALAGKLKGLPLPTELLEESLWQARLLLVLAEEQTRQDRELASALAAASQREGELWQQLRGEEIESPPEIAFAPPPVPPGRNEQLLRAWARLYLADSRPERPNLLTTAQPESAGRILDEYRALTKRQPERLCTIPVPAIDPEMSASDFAERRRAFRTAAHDLLPRLSDLLSQAASAAASLYEAESRQAAAELAESWQEIMGSSVEAPAVGEDEAPRPAPPAVLTFYRLTGTSFSQLFQIFCRQETKVAEGPAPPHAVLGVVGGSNA